MKTSIVKIYAFFLICSLMVLGACKKDSVKAKADLLVGSAWKYSTAQYGFDNSGTAVGTLPPGVLQNCDLDNIVTFKADKTGIADEGPTKCNPTDAQTKSFSWALSNNDTQLVITGVIFTGIGDTFKVVELTDSKMVVSQQLSTANINPPLAIPLPVPLITVIVTFIH